MAEWSEAVEEKAVRDGSGFYSVEADVAATENVPPGYKRTEVGVIPEDWEVTTLGEQCKAIIDGTHYTPRYVVHGVPFYSVENVTKNDFSNVKHISEEEHNRLTRRCKPEVGDILMTRIGSLGATKILDWEVDASIYVSLALLKLGGNIDPHYTYAYSKSDQFVQDVEDRSLLNASPKKINMGEISAIPLPIPPRREEQRAIATALSDADALIVSLDRLIAKKRAIKQAAMQQLLTGQTRLPGFTGEWETKRLGDHVSFLKTGTNSRAELASNGRVAYLHYGDIHVRASVTLNPNAVTMPHIAASKVRHLDKLAPGDLVFVDASEDLEGVGKSVEIIDVPKEGMVAGLHTIAARFDKDVLADGFKAYLQFCPQFIGTLRRLAAGTKVLATNRQHVANVEMELPCVAEQQAIAAVLSDMDAEIETLERRRDKARQIKQGMMQQLLTGRTRLV